MGVTAAVAARPRRRFRGGLEIFATAAVLAGAVVLACLGLLRFTGHLVVIDRGDLLVTHAVEARTVRPGDQITFSDRTRAGRSVTQRVVSISGDARLEFVTRANGASEEWSIAADGTVGQRRLEIPTAGRAMAWLGGADGRIVLVVLPLLYLAVFALRRIRAS